MQLHTLLKLIVPGHDIIIFDGVKRYETGSIPNLDLKMLTREVSNVFDCNFKYGIELSSKRQMVKDESVKVNDIVTLINRNITDKRLEIVNQSYEILTRGDVHNTTWTKELANWHDYKDYTVLGTCIETNGVAIMIDTREEV